VKFSFALPTHRVDPPGELLSAAAIGQLAAAAEAAGFDAVSVTEHPFPPAAWVRHGGHHALDPLVALACAAAATRHARLHTNLFVLPYRNPFLAAKSVASLDVVSGGRVILGVGAGYLEGEFEALGVPFAGRNGRLDRSIAAMRAAWTGRLVDLEGDGWAARGNQALPVPLQEPHPPLWIGGNSLRAARRAVELGDGWAPFMASPGVAGATRTAAIAGIDELAQRIAQLGQVATEAGRTSPFDVVTVPTALALDPSGPDRIDAVDLDAVAGQVVQLAAAGVTWCVVTLPGADLDAQLASVSAFANAVIAPGRAPA
jgi:probable F420-dependent oxidoreductase